jgi:hypothetical protein
MTLKEIYTGALNLINQYLRKESVAQGHYLTGAMDDSFDGKVTGDTLEGFAVYYARFVMKVYRQQVQA